MKNYRSILIIAFLLISTSILSAISIPTTLSCGIKVNIDIPSGASLEQLGQITMAYEHIFCPESEEKSETDPQP